MKKQLLLCITACCLLTVNDTKAQTQVTFYTTMGKFVVEMYEKDRPITTKNFLDLVKKKFYDKIIFHRVIDNFMIQGGDPTGTGSGGSGVIIKDELSAPNKNVPKTISMANSGPNTGESQFFINLVTNAHLDTKHSVFGIVVSNFPVVQAIGKVKTNSNDKPLTPVVMDSVRITPPIPTEVEETATTIQHLQLFPNPATNASQIFINVEQETSVQLSVFNQQGQLIGVWNKTLVSGINQIELGDIVPVQLTAGMYYLMVTDGRSISREKFIITE